MPIIKPKILFYTRPCYLDAALEYINLIKEDFELTVVIQLSESEKKSNILNLNVDLNNFSCIEDYNLVRSAWSLDYLSTYFANCEVKFAIMHSSKSGTLKTNHAIKKLVADLMPDYVHFDDFTGKQVFLLGLLLKYRSKLILNIHDPLPHSGEFSLVREIVRRILYRLPKRLVFFSKYSEGLFAKRNFQTSYILKLLPYTVFQRFVSVNNATSKKSLVSFVGRISKYKGVELFMKSIPLVLSQYPNQKFVIAGKSLFNYSLDSDHVLELKSSLKVFDKHLTNTEMADIISESRLIVCPYLDATQSGVILTAHALNTPVVVTGVGGLPEYIVEGTTGGISKELTPVSLATEITKLLEKLDGFREGTMTPTTFSKAEDRLYNLKMVREVYKG